MGVYITFRKYLSTGRDSEIRYDDDICVNHFYSSNSPKQMEIEMIMHNMGSIYPKDSPYGIDLDDGYPRIVFVDEIEEAISKIKKIKCSGSSRYVKKVTIKFLQNLIEWMNKNNIGAVSRDYW